MKTSELIRLLEFQYWSILDADPDRDEGIVQFLLEKGINKDNIWSYFPQEAREEGWDEPEWL